MLLPLAEVLGHMPETPIHIALTDETDNANGFAQVIPYNHLVLFASPPDPLSTLGDYDDFMRLLVVHELAHIVHLDTVHGLPEALNDVLGKTVAPNAAQPSWVLEGIAVWLESRLTSAGRVRSALVDMLMRAQILYGTFPEIDQISTLNRWFPGSAPHLIGGRFIDFVARRHGPDAIAFISNVYGGRVLPFGINIVARRATGEDHVEMWAAWKAAETARAEVLLAPVRAEGVRAGCPVTLREQTESAQFPRWSPDGKLAYVDSPDHGDTELVVLRDASCLAGAELLRIRSSSQPGAFTPDGTRYVDVVQDVSRRAFSYRDLRIVHLRTGEIRRRTRRARMFDPSVSPDGRRIAAIRQHADRHSLHVIPLEGDEIGAPLVEFEPLIHAARPRWSPDGKTIALSAGSPDSSRRIVLVDALTGVQVPLTALGARDLSPDWSPDGRAVFFSSDRGGIFNIHRADVVTGAIERISNVETGAFEPAVDPTGTRIAYAYGTNIGFEIRMLDVPAVPWPPLPPAARSTATSSAAAITYPEESYAAWETLLPRAWSPSLSASSDVVSAGVIVSGQDAVGLHEYRLRVDFESRTDRLSYGLTYVNRMLSTPLFLTSSLGTSDQPGVYDVPIDEGRRVESIWRFNAGIDIPLGRWDGDHGITFSYGVETRKSLTVPPDDPFQTAPRTSGDLFLAPLGATWHFGTARSYTDSISRAAGVNLDVSVRLHHPLLGSDLEVLEVSSHATAFVTMPWLRHHVLAFRVAGGVSAGDPRGRTVFGLGGLPVRDVLTDIFEDISFGVDTIRGYPVGALRGPSFYLGSAEYRLPLWVVERGMETVPFFFDRLHAAVFVDAGDTPARRVDFENVRAGAGGELRVDFVVGYFLSINARVGFAKGLGDDGIAEPYLVLGSGF